MSLNCSSFDASDTQLCEAIKKLQADEEATNVALDTFWLIFAGALVFFMQAGFAMLCAGSVRSKNVSNIMLKNLLDACGGGIGFWSIGYAFAYGDPREGDDGFRSDGRVSFIGGRYYYFLMDMASTEYALWFFQFAFAATAATIVAGTIAERCKMSAYLCYSTMLTGFVYPVVVHMIWSSWGYLSAFNSDPFLGSGMIDFAGSGVVHMTGGLSALLAAIVLGPRIGRFYDSNGAPLETPKEMGSHNVSLQILGTFILWVGWYGFNPGSTLVMNNSDHAGTAALCAATTTIAAATGCVSALFLNYCFNKDEGIAVFDLACAMNGCLSGLVAITAGCSVVYPSVAVFIGGVAGAVYLGASKLLVKFKIDDVVDAIPVHFANGLWGVIAVGLCAAPDLIDPAYGTDRPAGWFYEWGRSSSNFRLMACQLSGICFIIAWVTATMFPFFYLLKVVGWFRVNEVDEEIGMDLSHHGGSTYTFEKPDPEVIAKYEERRQSKIERKTSVDSTANSTATGTTKEVDAV